jgi:DNA-binding transcriptional ArsR family regulator
MDIAQKAHPLLLTLVKIQRKNDKDYSYPAQLKFLELMAMYQNIKKSRATLNRWLRVVEDGKYIIRRRRIKRDPRYGLMFKSTLYKITIKGYRLLSRFGVDMSKEIAQYEKWLEEINPDYKAIKTKKMLEAYKRNDHHKEFMRGIVEKL